MDIKDIADIKRYISVVRRSLDLIEQKLDGKETIAQSQTEIEVIVDDSRNKHIEQLLSIDCWPEAVSAKSTSKPTYEDQINRANSVLDWQVDKSLEGLNFLDYGCGEGYIAKKALDRGIATSTAYDIKQYETWTDSNVIYTTKTSELKQSFYDVIFLYDVIDHCIDAVETMKHVKTLLKPNGVVYLRCHPWTSKHASHLFKEGLNKAFIHLFLKEQEIKDLGYQSIFTRMEKNPLEAYHWFFDKFKIEKEQILRENISDFFLVEAFKELVFTEQEIPAHRHKGFISDMSITFIDYKLTNN